MIEEGRKAPAFRLKDQLDRVRTLSDFAGSWLVIYFYPKDMTPGCTVESCEFSGLAKEFHRRGAQVVGCSPDDSESHRKFIQAKDLKCDLLSDPDHAMMEKYAAWGEKVLYGRKSTGVIRSTVLIDPAGRVARHWKRAKAAGHAQQVLKALDEAMAAAKKRRGESAGK